MYWGGLFGVGVVLIFNYYFSEENECEKLIFENEKLKVEMEFF